MEPQYKTTFSQASLPPVDGTGPTKVINYSFTVTETMYIGFVIKALKTQIDDGVTFAFLGASEKMQQDFTQFVKNNFEAKRKFTVAEVELNGIVSSIWEKTKLYVQNTLESYGHSADLINEHQCLNTADQLKNEMLNGRPGKMITKRQADLLITFASKLKT